jgi:hypothetical protein
VGKVFENNRGVRGGYPFHLLRTSDGAFLFHLVTELQFAEGLSAVIRAFDDKIISLIKVCSSTLEKGEGSEINPSIFNSAYDLFLSPSIPVLLLRLLRIFFGIVSIMILGTFNRDGDVWCCRVFRRVSMRGDKVRAELLAVRFHESSELVFGKVFWRIK